MGEPSYKTVREEQFYKATAKALVDIEERAMKLPPELQYPAVYSIMQNYVETLLLNITEAFTDEEKGIIRILLKQFASITREEDEHPDVETGERQAVEYIPQFPDGSGWDLDDKKTPYFYEHISLQEVKRLKRLSAKQLYKVVMIVPTPLDYHHKDTYFVKGSQLDYLLEGYSEYAAYVVGVERVDHMPSTEEKLKE